MKHLDIPRVIYDVTLNFMWWKAKRNFPTTKKGLINVNILNLGSN